VAYLIQFEIIKSAKCHQLNFWKMLELIFEVESTKNLINTLYKIVHILTNLITLNNNMHAMFNNGNITSLT